MVNVNVRTMSFYKHMKGKRLIIAAITILLSFIAGIIFTNGKINSYDKYTFDNINEINPAYCAIVLGTSKYLKDGKENQYYNNRMKAAYKARLLYQEITEETITMNHKT
jgi:vancomycin permeability regulator SanA